MVHNLAYLVRETYTVTMRQRREDTAAFERAVEALLDHVPRLCTSDARREVARMLAEEPAEVAART